MRFQIGVASCLLLVLRMFSSVVVRDFTWHIPAPQNMRDRLVRLRCLQFYLACTGTLIVSSRHMLSLAIAHGVQCCLVNMMLKTYYAGTSVIHRADARLKIGLLAFATVGVFCVKSIAGMLVCWAILLLLLAVSRVPARAYGAFLPLALVFMCFPVLFNGFSFDVYATQDALSSYYETVDDWLANAHPFVLFGTFGFVPAGLAYGMILGLRIFILIYLGLLFTFTTEASAVVNAISWFLAPLSRVGVPVRDISLVFSLALRFIPVVAQEFSAVANAHRCRGAYLDKGSLLERMKAWGNVFIPLFVRLFRRADTLGCAMDARCYGASHCNAKKRGMDSH